MIQAFLCKIIGGNHDSSSYVLSGLSFLMSVLLLIQIKNQIGWFVMVPLWKQSRRSFFMLDADRVQRGADPK